MGIVDITLHIAIEDSIFYVASSTHIAIWGMNLDRILKDFDNFLLLEKGLGETTRKGHMRSILAVIKNIGENIPTNEELRQYILEMYGKNYSHSHIVNTITSIEYFTKFIGKPMKIKKTRRPKKDIVHYLTEAEVIMMISACKNLREKCMVAVLAFSGIRNKELCNLKIEDVDIGNNQLAIRMGKYSKDRRVYISSMCSNLLFKYIMEYKKAKNDNLFTTIKKGNKYKTNDLRKTIKTISKRAGISKRVFPHMFRHSLATNLLKRGAGMVLIMNQLGHTEISTTMNYIKRLPSRLQTEYEFYAPAYL